MIGGAAGWASAASALALPPAPVAPSPARTDSLTRSPLATPATRDTSRTRSDSIAVVGSDTTSGVFGGGTQAAAPDTARKRRGFDAPRWVMLRSLVVPGWGQLTNGSWLKALAVAGVEVGLGLGIANDARQLDRLLGDVDQARAHKDPEAELIAVTAYNDRQTSLVSKEWLLGGAVAYALMDAYVDAHFRRFKVEFKRERPSTQGLLTPAPTTRLLLGWSF